MYEYQSKEIKDLKSIIRKGTAYFIGSFTLELLMRREEWENPETKTAFIESLHQEYFAWDKKCSIDYTRNRVNCAIRIIESHMVEDAMEYILGASDKKIEIPEIKENAEHTLSLIKSGKLKY